jgi:hypothetical protein
MRKTLQLDHNLTLIFFSDGHSLRPRPHLLPDWTLPSPEPSTSGFSMSQEQLFGEELSLGSNYPESICLGSTIRVTI